MATVETNSGMPVVAALQTLVERRGSDQIVVTNQGSARIWPKLCRNPLDLNYNPSAMGGAIPLALGLALAQPQRQVLVLSGDGSLLMNLGSLVTVIGTGVTNLSIILLDNGRYEVTGGQKTAASATNLEYAGLARAAGFATVARFDDLVDWQQQAATVFAQPGPRFVWLLVQPANPEDLRGATPPIDVQLAELRQALSSGA